MKKFLLVGLMVLALPSLLRAQTQQVIATDQLAWDQPAPSLADAQAYVYKLYTDGGTQGVTLSGVTCSGTASPFLCQLPFPAFTPGVEHTIVVTASNLAGESAKTGTFKFTFIIVPQAPSNVRQLRGGGGA